MAVSANEFWQQLTRIGAVDSASCDVWIAKFKALLAKRAASNASSATALADDAKSIAQFLIANRVLTKFQSQRLVAGRGSELRLGDFLIVDRCDQSPLSRWYLGKDLRTSASCFIYPCTDDLTSSRWVDPEWLGPHAAIQVPSLQSIEIISLSSSDPWRGAVVSHLPSGRPLNQWAADHGVLDPATTASIGQVISSALASMHDVGLVHGELRPSRIWCGEDRSLWLLRDAGRPPCNPSDPPQEHRWFDDDSAGELYAAPELADPNAEPNFASDLYAIGAVLYELSTGRRLLGEAFAGTVPREISEACELGAAGDPLMRTLAFAIDPDPAARFPDVLSFARALGVVATASLPLNVAAIDASNAVAETTSSLNEANGLQVAAPEVKPPKPPAIDTHEQNARVTTAAKPNEQSASRVAKVEAGNSASSGDSDKTKKRRAPNPPDSSTQAEAKDSGITVASGKTTELTEDAAKTNAAKAIPSPKPVAAPVGLSANTVAAPAVAAKPVAEKPVAEKPVAEKPVAAPKSDIAATATPPEPPPRKLRKRTRRTRRGPIIIGSVAAVVLLMIVGLLLRPGDLEPPPRPRPALPPRPVSSIASTPNPATTKPVDAGTADATSGYELVSDGNLLWAAPWPPEIKPPTLEMIPPGAQFIVTLRLSRIVGDSAGSRWLDWLGPELKPALEALEKRAAVKVSDIDRLTIAAMGSASGSLKACFSVSTRQPVSLKSMTDAWNVSPSRTKDGKTIYSNEDLLSDVFYIRGEPKDATSEITSFVFGPVEQITLVAENDGGAIPLPRTLQQLWDTSSQDADVVAMTVPNFLFADGRELLQLYAPRSIDSLREWLIPDIAGVTVSMSLVEHWYTEARFSTSGTVTPPMMLQTLKPRVDQLPAWAESFAIDAAVDPSWKAMAIRLPQFMRALTDQTRYGISKTLPMANFYLPADAAPQVALSTLLALSSAESAPASVAAAPEPMESMTVMQMIDHPMSVSFDQESLEFAVAAIRDEFIRSLPEGSNPPTFTIIGGDLEKMGITQNQQIRNFQMRDKPLRDALSELVRQANPDKSVTALSDVKQSLVWVVDTTAPADKPTILITTRPATETKKLALSKEFTGE
jgi:serine/threonine protein kinase